MVGGALAAEARACQHRPARSLHPGRGGRTRLPPRGLLAVRLRCSSELVVRHFGCVAHGVSAARVTARRSTRPVPRAPWGRPACVSPSSRAGRVRAGASASTSNHGLAGRAAVRSRHHSSGTRSTGPRRRSRGRTCTHTCRSSRRPRWARAGGCSSRTWVGVPAWSHYASERSHTDRPGGSTPDRPDRVRHRTGER